MLRSWLFLLIAILLEVAGTTCLKLSHGFARPLPSSLGFVFFALALTSLTLALRRIEVSTAYAIWSGLGSVLITVIGVFFFHDAMTPGKVASITMIVAGTIALQQQAPGEVPDAAGPGER